MKSISSGIISLANQYLESALTTTSEEINQDGDVVEKITYCILTGEVIYIYKKGDYVHHITTGDGDAYEMQVSEQGTQSLNENKLEVASVLLEIYVWYHKHD